jgi:hypothetical protein
MPSEFVGKSFEDITPIEVRELDVANARLVIAGKIKSYLMHKSYRFQDGTVKDITLLVARVPWDTGKEFMFFLSRIIPDAEKLSQALSTPEKSSSLIEFTKKHGKWLVSIGAVIGGVILKLLGKI